LNRVDIVVVWGRIIPLIFGEDDNSNSGDNLMLMLMMLMMLEEDIVNGVVSTSESRKEKYWKG
jgi:hypothetical protein